MGKPLKILIAIPPAIFPPAGAAYVAAALKQAGFQVAGHTFRSKQLFENELSKGFDVLATGGLCSQYREIKSMVDSARKAGLKTILGGGIVTSEPELITRAVAPDVSILGQGEITAVELLRRWQEGADIDDLPGIGYLTPDGTFTITPPRPEIKDLDSIPFPDYEVFDISERLASAGPADRDMLTIVDDPREYPIIGSRSCPFRCTFCWHSSGGTYRRRSLENIMAELAVVIPKYKINVVSFYDELFAHDKARLLEFCRRFKELQTQFPWQIRWFCCLHVSHVTAEILDALQESGCYLISYGFESFSVAVLKSMNKRASPEQINYAISETLKRKIAIQGNFIFGDPAETWETAMETLTYWRTQPKAGISLGYIVPCPDSADYRYCLTKGLIKDRLRHITKELHKPVNMTAMSDGQYYKLLVNLLAEGVLHSSWARVTQDGRARCPHCNGDNHYKGLRPGLLSKYRLICRHCAGHFNGASPLGIAVNMAAARLMPRQSWVYRIYWALQAFRNR